MKRVGIMTIQKCGNYGADLQAYALGAKLRMMGCAAENIDYLFYKNPRHQGGKMERPVLPVSFKNRAKEALFPLLEAARGFKGRARRAERARKFAAWFAENVRTGREYRSVESLYDDPPRYDIYMAGSDQVWNPRLFSNIRPYFLDFAPFGAKCVSYASSFGVDTLSGPVFYRYKQWLKRFSHVGLREKSGERIVNAMALDAEVAHVLDPTLLLKATDWARVAVEPCESPQTPYLLLYDLIRSEETVALAVRWAKELGVPVVRIGDGAYGPGEFAWLFAHADAVVTNSFHGTAFSIINGRPFFSVVPHGMTNAGRIESLLASLSLSGRLAHASECSSLTLSREIDFDSATERLERLRASSEAFIRGELDAANARIVHGGDFARHDSGIAATQLPIL